MVVRSIAMVVQSLAVVAALTRGPPRIAAGRGHTCAILGDGSVRCFGANGYGQLGLGHTNDLGDEAGEMTALPAVNLGVGRTAVAVAASRAVSLKI